MYVYISAHRDFVAGWLLFFFAFEAETKYERICFMIAFDGVLLVGEYK